MKRVFLLLLSTVCTVLVACSVLPKGSAPTYYVAPPAVECNEAISNYTSYYKLSAPSHLLGSRIFYQNHLATRQVYGSLRWIAPLPEVLETVNQKIVLCSKQQKAERAKLSVLDLYISSAKILNDSSKIDNLTITVEVLKDNDKVEFSVPVVGNVDREAIAEALQRAILSIFQSNPRHG